jgi:hypothetical protein
MSSRLTNHPHRKCLHIDSDTGSQLCRMALGVEGYDLESMVLEGFEATYNSLLRYWVYRCIQGPEVENRLAIKGTCKYH